MLVCCIWLLTHTKSLSITEISVLFKLKPDVTAQQVDNLREMVLGMHGQIPGSLSFTGFTSATTQNR